MDRFTWFLVGGILGLVGLGLAVALTVRVTDTPPDLATPAGVTLAYAQALERGEPERAWDLLATSTQAGARRDEFLLRASTRGRVDDRARLTAEGERIEGDTASVTLARTFPSSGDFLGLNSRTFTNRESVKLVREAGSWRLTVPPDAYLLLRTVKP